MTVAEFKKLPVGTKIIWDGDPALGVGEVRRFALGRRETCVSWPDGQTTCDSDDWSLERCTVQEVVNAR